jgi:predicted acyl esterase
LGGWYDGEDLSGALHTYRTIEKNNPHARNNLVMGPWTHGGWHAPDYNNHSRIPFTEADKHFYLNEIEYPFFTHYLKGQGDPDLPNMHQT